MAAGGTATASRECPEQLVLPDGVRRLGMRVGRPRDIPCPNRAAGLRHGPGKRVGAPRFALDRRPRSIVTALRRLALQHWLAERRKLA